MGKPQEQRRKEIVQATLDLTAEQGIKRVTTQAIADKVGIAQPTVFRHFKTRDDIFASVIGWIAENLSKAILSGTNPADQADEQLRKLIQSQLTFINKHRAIPRVLFSDLLHLDSPRLKSLLQELMNGYIKRVTQLLQQGKETGVFREELDVDQTGRYIAALIQGLVLRWSVYEFNFSLEKEAEIIWGFLTPVLKPDNSNL